MLNNQEFRTILIVEETAMHIATVLTALTALKIDRCCTEIIGSKTPRMTLSLQKDRQNKKILMVNGVGLCKWLDDEEKRGRKEISFPEKNGIDETTHILQTFFHGENKLCPKKLESIRAKILNYQRLKTMPAQKIIRRVTKQILYPKTEA